MIIDVHTHIGEVGPKEAIRTAETLLASMDEAGIDISLIIAADIPDNTGWKPLSVDEVVNVTTVNPTRLKTIGNISIHKDIPKQLNMLEKHIKEKSIVGIKMYPGYEDYYPTDDRVMAVYEFAEAMSVPVMFHTGLLLAESSGILKQVHPLHIDEVAHRFPNLIIVMAHFGNPWVTDAAAVVWKNERVYVDVSGFFPEHQTITQNEIDYFIKQFGVFTDLAGMRKCMFGTDWPLYSQREYLAAVYQIPMTDEEKELVLWKNAVQVFGLKEVA